MTPCEELGYKIGDRFKVVQSVTFELGSIIELVCDDGTECPHFVTITGKTVLGGYWAYTKLCNIEPLVKPSLEFALENTIKGSNMSVEISSDGSVSVFDEVMERSCVVDSLHEAMVLVEAVKGLYGKIGELGDWE